MTWPEGPLGEDCKICLYPKLEDSEYCKEHDSMTLDYDGLPFKWPEEVKQNWLACERAFQRGQSAYEEMVSSQVWRALCPK